MMALAVAPFSVVALVGAFLTGWASSRTLIKPLRTVYVGSPCNSLDEPVLPDDAFTCEPSMRQMLGERLADTPAGFGLRVTVGLRP
jgi:hypothetical protein